MSAQGPAPSVVHISKEQRNVYYSIDDQHGTVSSGIQFEHRAREIAQGCANESGKSVLLYSSDGELEELIAPESPAHGAELQGASAAQR